MIKKSKKILKNIASRRHVVFSKANYFRHQFKNHVSTAVIAAFSFIIALAWKDLIMDLVDTYIKPEALQNWPYLSALITAIIVTVVAIIGIMIIAHWAKSPES